LELQLVFSGEESVRIVYDDADELLCAVDLQGSSKQYSGLNDEKISSRAVSKKRFRPHGSMANINARTGYLSDKWLEGFV